MYVFGGDVLWTLPFGLNGVSQGKTSMDFKNKLKVEVLCVLRFLNFNLDFFIITKKYDFFQWEIHVYSVNNRHFLGRLQ